MSSEKKTIEREISPARVQKAVDALLKYIGKQNEKDTSLIEDEDYLYLVRLWILHVHGVSVFSYTVTFCVDYCFKEDTRETWKG